MSTGQGKDDRLESLSQPTAQKEVSNGKTQDASSHASQVKKRIGKDREEEDGSPSIPLHPAMQTVIHFPVLYHGLSAVASQVPRQLTQRLT